MKKIFLISLFYILINFAFSESNSGYVVKRVLGKVSCNKVDVNIDDILMNESEISVGLNSILTVSRISDCKLFTIKSMKSGKLSELLLPASSITIGNKISESSINTNTKTKTTNISTAATRANEFNDELDWGE